MFLQPAGMIAGHYEIQELAAVQSQRRISCCYTLKSESWQTLYVGMSLTLIQHNTNGSLEKSAKNLVISFHRPLTFLFGCSVTNKTVELAKNIAEVLNWKLAKLPNNYCSYSFFFLLSLDGLSQHCFKYSQCTYHELAALFSTHVHDTTESLVTSTALIKRETRHSSSCLGV